MEDIGDGLFCPFGEGVGGVAVGAAEVAGGQPHKDAGQTGESAFALEAQVNFVDYQCFGHGRSLNPLGGLVKRIGRTGRLGMRAIEKQARLC